MRKRASKGHFVDKWPIGHKHPGMHPLNPESVTLVKAAAQRLREVMACLPDTLSAFLENELLQDRVTLRFILAVQDCISIAAEVASQRGLRPDGGMGQLFEALAEDGVLPKSMVLELQAVVGIRNQILFDFDSLHAKDLFEAASEFPEILVTFLSYMSGQEENE